MRCPSCHAGIEERGDGVQCVGCAAPYHEKCWNDHGAACSVAGCASVRARPLGRLSTARIVVGAGKAALRDAFQEARERLGGKSIVLLFLVSVLVSGLGAAPLLHYGLHASRKVELEVVLGLLFLALTIWIAALLHRGARLEDDLDVRPGRKHLREYYSWLGGFTSSTAEDSGGGCSSGCGDLGGCSSDDPTGVFGAILAIVVVAIVACVVLPFIAWLAIEVLLPIVVVAIYGVLYAALAFAVNTTEDLRGKPIACAWRAAKFAALYTCVVAVLIGAGAQAVKRFGPAAPAPLPAEKPR